MTTGKNMTYKEIINKLEPIEYSKYSELAHEKLIIYTALILEEKQVPLTYNYLCIAGFKLFPDVFSCDGELKEYPSVDRLYRAMVHLKYVEGKPRYLAGSPKSGYTLTKLGKQQAETTRALINGTKITEETKQKKKDNGTMNKQGYGQYSQFLESSGYKKYEEKGEFDGLDIRFFFKITPFTQTSYVKKTLNTWLVYAKEENKTKCIEYINNFLSTL